MNRDRDRRASALDVQEMLALCWNWPGADCPWGLTPGPGGLEMGVQSEEQEALHQ